MMFFAKVLNLGSSHYYGGEDCVGKTPKRFEIIKKSNNHTCSSEHINSNCGGNGTFGESVRSESDIESLVGRIRSILVCNCSRFRICCEQPSDYLGF